MKGSTANTPCNHVPKDLVEMTLLSRPAAEYYFQVGVGFVS